MPPIARNWPSLRALRIMAGTTARLGLKFASFQLYGEDWQKDVEMSRVTRLPIVLAKDAHAKASFVHVRSQMPVGQGGFHVGALSSLKSFRDLLRGCGQFKAADFLYAYDCGSIPKRHVLREIRRLEQEVTRPHLDLFGLSHFDLDHICGTPHLLGPNGSFSVDTIILPYVDYAERLIAFGAATSAAEEGGRRIDTFFARMAVDPVATLAELGARRIFLIRGEGEDGPLEGGGEFPDPRPDRDREREPRDSRFSVSLKSRPGKMMEETRLGTVGAAEVSAIRDADIVFNDPTYSIVWKLRPYVKRADASAIALFKSLIEVALGWPRGSFGRKTATTADRTLMVTQKRKAVGDAYKTAFEDKNLTSMSLYSGPFEPETLDAIGLNPSLGFHQLTKVGWLGTGDAHLKEGEDIDAFEEFYSADIDHTTTFVFPHHGSINNTDDMRLISHAENWVAAADPVHDWEHPHYLLRVAVADREARFRHVRSPVGTAFRETFILTHRSEIELLP
ncbi:MAG: hypothetical protein NVV72_10565 [Asticcacaulis sp.]|nr:hypothetical protein [Asticcacaulis sp.]